MIQIHPLILDPAPAARLGQWQAEIDALPDYADRVAMGKSRFSSRNTGANATFRHIKVVLTRMCQGARRCGYCEDSYADEVEHIQPKDLYPESVFRWENYLYACGPCNGPKNNQFAVLQGNPPTLLDVTCADGAPIVPPIAGQPALINPRTEDPLHFLFLDILNTFAFAVRDAPQVSDVDKLRAYYSIKVLRLNDRDALVEARRTAFGNYRARLVEYVTEKQNGTTAAELDRRRNELLRVDHQTVWREMQRQHLAYPILSTLFASAPEALGW